VDVDRAVVDVAVMVGLGTREIGHEFSRITSGRTERPRLESRPFAVHANAIAADVHWHRVSSHGQLGYNRTKLASLIYNHQFQIDPRPVRVIDSCFPRAIGVHHICTRFARKVR